MPYKDIEARRAKNRRWREANREYVREYARTYCKENREKVLALEKRTEAKNPGRKYARTRVAKRVNVQNKWPRPSFFVCTDCDARAEEYHHEDYSLWWSVLPLCKDCHVKRHTTKPSA